MRRPAAMIGGDVLRAVGRAVGAGASSVMGAVSVAGSRPAKPAHVLRVSSSGASSPPSCSSPTFASARDASIWSSHDIMFDGEEWERVEGEEEEASDEVGEVEDGVASGELYVFGTAPSREEVEYGVSALQQILAPNIVKDHESQVVDDGSPYIEAEDADNMEIIALDMMYRGSSSESLVECQSDWIEPAMQLYSSNPLMSKERERVYGVLQLFQTNPSIQRVVLSLSSDSDVWDAVMNNEVVQEVKKSICQDASESNGTVNSDEHSDTDTRLLKWIFNNSKAKIIELIDMITKLAHKIFQPQKNEMNEKNDAFDEVVRSSLMITIMVFMIIIMTRIHKA